MNKKLKYSSIFLIFTVLLVLAMGIASAADIDNSSDMEISDDIITDTVGDDAVSTPQTTDNNNIETKTIKEVDDDNTYTTTTSENKELVKNEKNLKASIQAGTVTANPNSGYAGDEVKLHITASGTALYTVSYTYTVTVKLNDTTYYTGNHKLTSARNGDLTFTVPDIEAGTYSLSMEWNYNNGFRGAVGTTPFTVIKTLTSTKISEVTDVSGEIGNTVIPVTVTDLNGNAISGTSTITVKDEDNTLIDNYSIENGMANISVPTVRTGDYELTVLFAGNDDYVNCTSTIPVSVSKAQTTLIVEEDDEGIYNAINAFENTVLSGLLIQTSNSNPIKNAELIVTVDGEEYVITTDDEGKYAYKYEVTQLEDTIPISIRYPGDDLYLASQEFSGTFDVEGLELNIILDEDPLSEVNETTTISGKLTDTNDNPVSDTEVNLEITGVEDIVTVTTDDEGKFSYDVVYNDVLEVTVVATMKNQVLYEAESASITFNVVVGPRRTNLTIETGLGTDNNINIVDITPYFNEVITNGTLIDIFGQPVVGATVKILLNGEDFSQVTDDEGKFQLVYNATEGLTTYTLNVEFEGNDAYKPAGEVYTGTFKTEAFDITVTIDDNFPEEILTTDDITISGTATLQNQTLKNNPIVLTIDGRTYTTTTDEEGKYSYTYTITRNGTIPIIANATFANADVKVGQKNIFVAHPIVNIDLDEVSDTTVLSDITLNGRIYIAQNSTGLERLLRFTINDKSIPLSSDEEGYFTYTFTPDTIGDYEISISYGTVVYEVHNASATINVRKRASQLENDKLPIAVKLNDIFTISGTLNDETNSPITDAEIIFIINNERFTNTTDANGHYEYNYQTTTVQDDNQYEVRYSGDENYILARNYVGSFFDVEAPNAFITIDDVTASLNQETSITGKVTDMSNHPLSNVNVKIVVNDVDEYETVTNDEGVYSQAYTPSSMGTYTVTATINDENYAEKTATTTFEVGKLDTTTTISPVRVTADYETNLTATVVDTNNNPVTGGKVVFKVNGKTIKDTNGKVVYIKVTDGQAILPHTFTQDDIDNNVSISAAYSGTTSYDSSQSQKVKILTIDQHNITMTLEDITAAQAETITITTTIKDYDDNVNTGKVIFKINGKTIKNTDNKVIYATVENGTASATYTIPETMKAKTYTISAIFTANNYNRTEANAQLTVTETTQNNNINGTNTHNSPKTESANTIIITNDNIDDYLTANGLSDLVSPGDTLDIQGTIDKQHSLVINKPINIISSTQDAVINLHTQAGSLMGEDPGNCFTVNKAGSGSNISNLYLYNTECWMFNNYDVTLYNMTMYVKDARVGSGVGQTAIRYCERMTIDSCNIYTENNGGSTSMALTGSSHILIKNTTIQGVGNVGNILYLGNRYNTGDKPSDFTLGVDTNITILNSTLKGECNAPINVMTYYGSVNYVSFINNTIDGEGMYSTIQVRNGSAIGNKFYQKASIVVQANCEAYDNVFYGTGQMTTYDNTTVYNNTLYTLEYYKNGNVYNNTIKSLKLYPNTELSNNIIDGDISIASSSSSTISNAILSNNTMTGNVDITGTSTRKTSNLQLVDNNIAGNVTVTYATNTKLTNNTINGTVTINSQATGTVVENNTIITSNPNAISNAATSTVVTNNYLISDNYHKLGADAIADTGRINKENNGPEISDFWTVSIDPVYATIGDNTFIQVNIVDEISGTPVEEGEVYLMINDDIVTDEEGNVLKESVSSSQALFDINSVPKEWLRSDAVLTAVFTSGTITKTNSSYMTILKREANVQITTEELTITPGQTVTLTAAVTDLETGEDLSGQLAFKLDNNSLEDANGELIVVDVVDGIATLEYTFTDNIATGTYTLTAVFENAYYQRCVGSETLVIE